MMCGTAVSQNGESRAAPRCPLGQQLVRRTKCEACGGIDQDVCNDTRNLRCQKGLEPVGGKCRFACKTGEDHDASGKCVACGALDQEVCAAPDPKCEAGLEAVEKAGGKDVCSSPCVAGEQHSSSDGKCTTCGAAGEEPCRKGEECRGRQLTVLEVWPCVPSCSLHCFVLYTELASDF